MMNNALSTKKSTSSRIPLGSGISTQRSSLSKTGGELSQDLNMDTKLDEDFKTKLISSKNNFARSNTVQIDSNVTNLHPEKDIYIQSGHVSSRSRRMSQNCKNSQNGQTSRPASRNSSRKSSI